MSSVWNPETRSFSLVEPVVRVLGPVSEQLIQACMRRPTGVDLLGGLDAKERRFILRRLRALAQRGLIENAAENV